MALDLHTIAEEVFPQMVDLRRDIHKNPEMAFQEERTAALVAERLESMGLEVRTGVGKTGVVGVLRGTKNDKTLLIRADMDALPVTEAKDLGFRSQNQGVMHA